MKTKLLLTLVFMVVLGGCILLWLPNVETHFDSDPNSFGKYLGTPLPASARVVRLSANRSTARDGTSLHLQAKIAMSREDFVKLAEKLQLTNEHTIIPSLNMFEQEAPGSWWDPPQIDVQLALADHYEKTAQNPNLDLDIRMIWVTGTAYIYKSMFEGPTGFEEKGPARPPTRR